MSLRSRSQRAAVKAVDYVEWSSEEEEEEEEDEEEPKTSNRKIKTNRPRSSRDGEGEEEEEGVWALRLVVTDDEERRYELVGEPFDAPLPPPIKPKAPPKPPIDASTSRAAAEGDGVTTTEAATASVGSAATTPEAAANGLKAKRKEAFYAAMKELEGGQNVGLLEGWWFCLRAASTAAADDFSQALALGGGGKKKLTKFPTEGLISCYLSYGPPNVQPKHRTVLYSLEDISYDVQQSYFSGLKDKKRQKTGKTYHVDRSSSPACETDQLVLRIENGKLMAARLFVEFKDLPEAWRKRVNAEERYRDTHEVLFRRREESKRVRFNDAGVSVRLYLCDDPPGQHLGEESTQIATEEQKNGRQKLKEKGEGAMLKTVLKTKVVDDEDEDSKGGEVKVEAAVDGAATAGKAAATQDSVVEAQQQQQQLSREEVTSKTFRELRVMLKERKLSTVGNKETLVQRLLGGQSGRPPVPAAAQPTTATTTPAEKEKAKPSSKRKRKSKGEESKEGKPDDAASEQKTNKKTKKAKTKGGKRSKERKKQQDTSEAAVDSEVKAEATVQSPSAGGGDEKGKEKEETNSSTSEAEQGRREEGQKPDGSDGSDIRPTLMSMKMGQLKEKCKEIKLKCSGKKDELISRLVKALTEGTARAGKGEYAEGQAPAATEADASEPASIQEDAEITQEKSEMKKETKKRKRTNESGAGSKPARRAGAKRLLVSASEPLENGATERPEGEEVQVEAVENSQGLEEAEQSGVKEDEQTKAATHGRSDSSAEAEKKQAELKKMKMPELKNLLKEHKFKLGGTKDDLVARLMDHYFPASSASSSSSTSSSETQQTAVSAPRASSRKRRATGEEGVTKATTDGSKAKAETAAQKRRKVVNNAALVEEEENEVEDVSAKEDEPDSKEAGGDEEEEGDKAPPPQSNTSPRSTVTTRGKGRGRGRGALAAPVVSAPRAAPSGALKTSPVASKTSPLASIGSPAGRVRKVGLSRSKPTPSLHPNRSERRASN